MIASTSKVVALTCLVLLAAALPPAAGVGNMGFTKHFFGAMLNATSPLIAKQLQSYNFPPTGGDCPSVSLNGGHWIDSIRLSRFAFDVAGTSHSDTSMTLQLTVPEVTVKGLNGSATWTSLTLAKYDKGPLSWSTCFQICFGSSPYTATTEFGTTATFSVAPNKLTSASVSYANLKHESWLLTNVSGKCVGTQDDFDKSFNQGLSAILNKNMHLLVQVVSEYFAAVLGNTTTAGFNRLSFAQETGTVAFVGSHAIPASVGAFPVPGNDEAHVKMVIPLTSKAISRIGVPSCTTVNGGNGNSGSSKFTFHFNRTGFCLGQSGSTVYLAAAVTMNTTSAASVFRTANQEEKKAPRTFSWKKPAGSKPLVVPRRAAHDFEAASSAFPSRGYFSSQLVNKVLHTASTNVSNALHSVVLNPLAGGPLADAEDYCSFAHSGFSWKGSKTDPIVAAISKLRDLGNGSVVVTISAPALTRLSGAGSFETRCHVQLPLGAPVKQHTKANFSFSMSSNDNEYSLDIMVSPSELRVSRTSSMTFALNVTYPDGESQSIFEPYAEAALFGTFGGAVTDATNSILTRTIAPLWLGKLQGLFGFFPQVASFGIKSDPANSIVVENLAEASKLPDLATAVPSTGAAQADGAFLSLFSQAPPFAVDSCESLPKCSTTGNLPSPVGGTVSLGQCMACTRAFGQANQAVLGVRFTAELDMPSVQKKGISQTSHYSISQVDDKLPSVHRAIPHMKGISRVATPIGDSAAVRAHSSVLFIGTATLTQSSLLASEGVTESLVGYRHAKQSNLNLPYADMCQTSHDSLNLMNVKTITPTVIRADSSNDGAVILQVALSNLPRTLVTNTVSFQTSCQSNPGMALQFTTQRAGSLYATVDFGIPEPTIHVKVSVGADGKVTATSINTTYFGISCNFSYSVGTSFTFNDYQNNYCKNTLRSAVTKELEVVWLNAVLSPLQADLTGALTAVSANQSCGLAVFNGGAHIVMRQGAACGKEIPTPTISLTSQDVLYEMDVGAAPAGVVSTKLQHQVLPTCTDSVLLSGINLNTKLTNCSTSGSVHDGRVLVAVKGTLPFRK